ncbi:uncharacterized protein LOC117329213 [Pecten maximus]|uniref:uncharacterized protein LOC117329213 n=1 Tax=Pecten maximus TaxID=6579 RepID=UPI001458AB2B|nr:uncharacterized protein LOC117329213 [Pecten maximus]XP_033742922.1 uncharacterized protein LOC117329213 [Pecten maximus]
MKYQVITRNRSMVNLQEVEHQVAILDAKQDLERMQQAVREWRNKKEVDPDCVQDSGSDSRVIESYTNSNQNEVINKNTLSNNISWAKGNEFRPLMVPALINQPIRKCFSEFQLCGDREVTGGTGVSVGDIFQEASLLLRKGSSNSDAAANMMRYLKPLGAESKHYTTPNQSAKNSPRDNLMWQQIQEEIADQGDGRQVLQEVPEVAQGTRSPHASKSSMGGDTRKQRREQQDADEDLDQISSMPYCHGRCGIVEVLPTIMEKTSPTASSSQRSFVSSSRSDEILQPKNALIKVKKGANTSALAKCSLCERFGSNSQIIFSIDNVKYTFSKSGQKRLEPYTGRNGTKDRTTANTNDNKTEPTHQEKSNNMNSSAGPYTRYENQNVHLPPINPRSDSSCSPHQENPMKPKHPSRVSLPPLTPQTFPSDRKLRLSDVCRADNKKLPPIPGHVVLKRKKKVHIQKAEMPRTPASLLNGCKLPPLKLPEVCGRGKPSRRQKYQGYQSPFCESIRNNSRCEEIEGPTETYEVGKIATEKNRAVEIKDDPTEEAIHLFVKVPTMEATVIDTPRTPRKRRGSKGSKTRKN